jgi:hypothetical protein
MDSITYRAIVSLLRGRDVSSDRDGAAVAGMLQYQFGDVY